MISKLISASALMVLAGASPASARPVEHAPILIVLRDEVQCLEDSLTAHIEHTRENAIVHLQGCRPPLGPLPIVHGKPPEHDPPYRYVKPGEPIADLKSKEGLTCALRIIDNQVQEHARYITLDFSSCPH
jgi:hypothetical protein